MVEKRNANNQFGERALFLYCTLTDRRGQAAREDAFSLAPWSSRYTIHAFRRGIVIIGLETGR